MMGMGAKMSLQQKADYLMRNAKKYGVKTQRMAQDVANMVGGRVTPLNFKKEESIKRKIIDEGFKNPNQIKDSARTTIVVDTPEQVYQAVKALKGKYGSSVARQKNQKFVDNGYTGVIINMGRKNGYQTEIQVNTAKMIYAKEKPEDAIRILGEKKYNDIKRRVKVGGGRGHALYEVARNKNVSEAYRNKANRISRNYYNYVRKNY